MVYSWNLISNFNFNICLLKLKLNVSRIVKHQMQTSKMLKDLDLIVKILKILLWINLKYAQSRKDLEIDQYYWQSKETTHVPNEEFWIITELCEVQSMKSIEIPYLCRLLLTYHYPNIVMLTVLWPVGVWWVSCDWLYYYYHNYYDDSTLFYRLVTFLLAGDNLLLSHQTNKHNDCS